MSATNKQQISELQIFQRTGLGKQSCDVAVGDRIEKIRKNLGLTQKELGKRIFLSQGRVSEIETGTYGLLLRDMPRWAMALECRVIDLMPESFLLDAKPQTSASHLSDHQSQ